jgi:cytochrome c peroxidase
MKTGSALPMLAAAAVLLAAAASAWLWRGATPGYDWGIAASIPPPAVPSDNPMSTAKVELGRRLFYDARLSINGTTACASCHVQALAFTDGRAVSIGATGEPHPRNAMSLVNVAYASRLTWANNLLDRLEDQALVPMFNERPVEMGLAGRERQLVELVAADPGYAAAFPRAFPDDPEPHSLLNIVRALAAFVRSIVSFESPYDAFLRGDTSALDASAQRGMDLFFSERLECFHCHGGFNFTDSSTHADATIVPVGFHNTGLYNVDGNGAYPPDNTGLYDMTGVRRDMGRFRAPSLRNVALTAPYMHDGSMATLDEVLDHYARGGRMIASGPTAGDGRQNPYKSEFLKSFELTAGERRDVLAFLDALTDPGVVSDPRWVPPAE